MNKLDNKPGVEDDLVGDEPAPAYSSLDEEHRAQHNDKQQLLDHTPLIRDMKRTQSAKDGASEGPLVDSVHRELAGHDGVHTDEDPTPWQSAAGITRKSFGKSMIVLPTLVSVH